MKKFFMFLALFAFILSSNPCDDCVEECKSKYVGIRRNDCISDCIMNVC